MWLQWELDPQKLWKQCLGEVLSPAACKKSVREVLLPDFLQEKIINEFFWVGNNAGTGGVGIIIAKKIVRKGV